MITGNDAGKPPKAARPLTLAADEQRLLPVPTFCDATKVECGTCHEIVRVVIVHEHTFRKKRHEWPECSVCFIKEERAHQ